DDDEPSRDQYGHRLPEDEQAPYPRCVTVRGDAKRLKAAGNAVPEVGSDDEHAQHVKTDGERIGKILHLDPIQIAHGGGRRSARIGELITWTILKRSDVNNHEQQEPEA